MNRIENGDRAQIRILVAVRDQFNVPTQSAVLGHKGYEASTAFNANPLIHSTCSTQSPAWQPPNDCTGNSAGMAADHAAIEGPLAAVTADRVHLCLLQKQTLL